MYTVYTALVTEDSQLRLIILRYMIWYIDSFGT
jgi:hypothetical protein